MVVNCSPNKTEYIVFGTSEGGNQTIPEKIDLGGKDIKKVTDTKVLGLLVDEKLFYVPHGRKVNTNINASWANMCKYTSKH